MWNVGGEPEVSNGSVEIGGNKGKKKNFKTQNLGNISLIIIREKIGWIKIKPGWTHLKNYNHRALENKTSSLVASIDHWVQGIIRKEVDKRITSIEDRGGLWEK